MFRNRVRPPTPPLDEVTAERLLRGAPIDDLPEAYQPLGQLLADARRPGTEGELAGSAAAAASFVAAHHVANGPRRRAWSVGASALLAVTLAASTGTAVAATQGALPRPIQQVAHEALGAVGISVPGTQAQRDHSDDRGGDSPAGNDADPASGSRVSSTPSTVPTGDAPAGSSGSEIVTGDGATGTDGTIDAGGQTPQGVAGENPNAGPGNNSGNGNPAPGEGNQGNGNGGNEVVTPETPSDHLPEQSNGKGNGPPVVPPGQTKKDT
jgi:hypothetical protein